jgi:UDP-glucose 4-epimerase
MKVLITGGCGFIGSNLAEELSKKYDVIVLDNLSSGSMSNIKDLNVEFVRGSITDLNLLGKLLKDVDYVSHQAAVVSVPESIQNPIKADQVNIRGTLNVLIAAEECGVEKVVNASSCAVYGDTGILPIKEDNVLKPLSPYAVTKIAAEHYCKVFNEISDLGTVSLRYFNVYGPRQNLNSEYAAVIPKFIQRLLKGRQPVIYGDGEQTRDFIFVKDVVRANILAMKGEKCGVFNVGTGKKLSINQLASLIAEIACVNLNPVHEQPREGDIRHSYGDISKAKDSLSFEPVYSLREGLKETVEWFRENL